MQGDVLVIDLSPMITECCICGVEIVNPCHGIAMYEGIPVHDDWRGNWGGFPACKACYDRHARGEMDMWMPGEEPVSE
jgi:hypothetical protein